MPDYIEVVCNGNVVAVITFRNSWMYPTNASPREQLERILATDHLENHVGGG